MAHLTVRGCTNSLTPIQDTLELIGGKWKIPIIAALAQGPKRFRELQRDVTGITAKMLSKELKDLETNQLVTRIVHDTVPLVVEYSLTEHSRSLEGVVRELHTWGAQHRAVIFRPAADPRDKAIGMVS